MGCFHGGVVICLLSNLGLNMMSYFVAPVLVPYCRSMGASTAEVALLPTVRWIGYALSLHFLSRLSDVIGTKQSLILALCGTTFSFIIQGSALRFGRAGIYIAALGSALGGLSGGSVPVLQTYVTKVSASDHSLLKSRLSWLAASTEAGHIALTPIAGIVSQVGLQWAFYVPAFAAVLLLVLVCVGFRNPCSLADQALVGRSITTESNAIPRKDKDPALWFMALGMFFYACTVTLVSLLMPLLLESMSFTGSGKQQALKSSMVMSFYGLCSFLAAMAFTRMSFISDRNCLQLGSVVVVMVASLYGIVVSETWELFLFHGLLGLGIGLVTPSTQPTLQRYVASQYPGGASQAAGFAYFGIPLGCMTAPILMGAVLGPGHERFRMDLAWFLAGITGLLMLLFSDRAMCRMIRMLRATESEPDKSCESPSSGTNGSPLSRAELGTVREP